MRHVRHLFAGFLACFVFTACGDSGSGKGENTPKPDNMSLIEALAGEWVSRDCVNNYEDNSKNTLAFNKSGRVGESHDRFDDEDCSVLAKTGKTYPSVAAKYEIVTSGSDAEGTIIVTYDDPGVAGGIISYTYNAVVSKGVLYLTPVGVAFYDDGQKKAAKAIKSKARVYVKRTSQMIVDKKVEDEISED